MNNGEENLGYATWQTAALSYLDALYGFAVALTHDRTEAEDLVQETYLQAVRHYSQYQPDSNLRAWLFAIMRNSRFKQLRHKRNHPESVVLDSDYSGEQGDYSSDPELLCIRSWERMEIQKALERLPDHYREIILLRDIEGFSYREMAEILDCPVGTIMSRLSRAREKLKDALDSTFSAEQQRGNTINLAEFKTDGKLR